MSEQIILCTRPADGVLQIQLNRPQALNALNTAVLVKIAETLTEVQHDNSVRVVVLTGNDRAFAAGADIAELQLAAKGEFPEEQRQQAWAEIRDFSKPIIAAVSGFALGGGCELMMHADIIVASRKAQFGQPEINLGIMPGAGGTQRLTRLIGKPAAMKLNLTGEFISADEALKLGLISEVVEPEIYLKRALEMASKIAAKATSAAQVIKQSVLQAYETGLLDGLSYEREHFLQIVTAEDAAEGISAFIEKRKPAFPGNESPGNKSPGNKSSGNK